MRRRMILAIAHTVLAVCSRGRIPICNCRVAESPVTTGLGSVATVPNDNPTDDIMTDDQWQAWQETVMRARRVISLTEQSPYVRLLNPIW
jgi:hypothetical protein